MFLDSNTLRDVGFREVTLKNECFWYNNGFGICRCSFQQAFKLHLTSFASLDLDVKYSGIRLNLFQKFRCDFTVDVNSFWTLKGC